MPNWLDIPKVAKHTRISAHLLFQDKELEGRVVAMIEQTKERLTPGVRAIILLDGDGAVHPVFEEDQPGDQLGAYLNHGGYYEKIVGYAYPSNKQ